MEVEAANKFFTIDQALLDQLFSCEKVFSAKPQVKDKSHYRHKESSFELVSSDRRFIFNCYIRESIELLEDFSIGIIFRRDPAEPIILARYNGNHGEHMNLLTKERFSGFHVHKLTMSALDAKIQPENYAELTNKYSTLREALAVFFEELKVTNYLDYFPELGQLELKL